jgi:hypothetical protein
VQKPHSRLGVVSFALAAFAGLLLLWAVGFSGYLHFTNPGSGGADPDDPRVLACGVAWLVAWALDLVALGQPNRKKVFALLGAILSILILLGPVALMLLVVALR